MTTVAACGSGVTSPSSTTATTFVSFVSQPGDGIGRGETRRFTPENARFAASASIDRVQVFIDIQEQTGVRWHLDLAAPPGAQLAPGSYAVNESVSPYFRTGPYLSFYGNGLGCIPLGRFTVRRVTFAGPNLLSELDATFEQRCPSSSQGLSGEVRIIDEGSSGGLVPNIAGAWTGFLEASSGFDRAQFALSQTGSTVTGTWTAGTGWSGTIEGKVGLGAFAGSMSFNGTFPLFTGPHCEGRAPIFAFVDDVQPPVFLSGQFIGSCQYMPVGILWRMQTRQ